MNDPRVLNDIADAMCWLGRHKMLYTDVRPANVIIQSDGSACLIDYDDIVLLDEPLRTGREVADKWAASALGSKRAGEFEELLEVLRSRD